MTLGSDKLGGDRPSIVLSPYNISLSRGRLFRPCPSSSEASDAERLTMRSCSASLSLKKVELLADTPPPPVRHTSF